VLYYELQMNCWHLLLTMRGGLGIKRAAKKLSVCRVPAEGARLQVPTQVSALYQVMVAVRP